jgi:hypothetical protein
MPNLVYWVSEVEAFIYFQEGFYIWWLPSSKSSLKTSLFFLSHSLPKFFFLVNFVLHPKWQEDLAKFGYKLNLQQEFF